MVDASGFVRDITWSVGATRQVERECAHARGYAMYSARVRECVRQPKRKMGVLLLSFLNSRCEI